MKCVGMQYLEAVRKLRASGFRPLREVYLSFVPDEEIDGHDGAEKFAESEVFKKMNVGVGRGLLWTCSHLKRWLGLISEFLPRLISCLWRDELLRNGLLLNSLHMLHSNATKILFHLCSHTHIVALRLVRGWTLLASLSAWQLKQKVPVLNKFGKPSLTALDDSNPSITRSYQGC